MKPTTPLGTPPSKTPQPSYQERISQELQDVIDRIPENEEEDLRAMLQEALSPWGEWIRTESKDEMAWEIVEKLMYLEFLPPTRPWEPPLKASEDQSPLTTVEQWLLNLTP